MECFWKSVRTFDARLRLSLQTWTPPAVFNILCGHRLCCLGLVWVPRCHLTKNDVMWVLFPGWSRKAWMTCWPLWKAKGLSWARPFTGLSMMIVYDPFMIYSVCVWPYPGLSRWIVVASGGFPRDRCIYIYYIHRLVLSFNREVGETHAITWVIIIHQQGESHTYTIFWHIDIHTVYIHIESYRYI